MVTFCYSDFVWVIEIDNFWAPHPIHFRDDLQSPAEDLRVIKKSFRGCSSFASAVAFQAARIQACHFGF